MLGYIILSLEFRRGINFVQKKEHIIWTKMINFRIYAVLCVLLFVNGFRTTSVLCLNPCTALSLSLLLNSVVSFNLIHFLSLIALGVGLFKHISQRKVRLNSIGCWGIAEPMYVEFWKFQIQH